MAFKINYLTETLLRDKGLLYKNKYLFSNVYRSTCFRMKERHVGQNQRNFVRWYNEHLQAFHCIN